MTVNDANVERLCVLSEDERHLRRGARVSDSQGDTTRDSQGRLSPVFNLELCLRGCWFLYQLRQISQIFRSAVNTSVLNLEQARAQYIYIDDPRFKGKLSVRRAHL